MSDYFIGQIKMVGFNFAPRDFAFCNGQLIAIQQNTALFSILGTTYGGNGTTTFALPDLRGRTPVGATGLPTQLGEMGGQESVTLLPYQIPVHAHSVNADTTAGTTRNPGNALYGSTTTPLHGPSNGSLVQLDPRTIAPAGGTQPHNNMQPYLAINFVIAMYGIYPSRN